MAKTNPAKKKLYQKWWFWAIVVLVIIPSIYYGASSAIKSASSQTVDMPAEKMQKFAEKLGVDDVLYSDILDKYALIGVSDISGIQKSEGWENGMTFGVNFSGYHFTAYEQDNAIVSIKSGTAYFYKDGGVVCTVSDRVLTDDQYFWITACAKSDVTDNLKSPSSAKFPDTVYSHDDWTIRKDGSTYYVESYVDAQNSLGVEIRNSFIVKYDWDGSTDSDPELVDIAIG